MERCSARQSARSTQYRSRRASFSLARSAQTFPLWLRAKYFGVTILSDSQTELSNRFARGGADKWGGLAPLRGANGVPLLRGRLVTFECETYAFHEGGDHEIVVGRVLSFSRTEAAPLLSCGGRYRRLASDQPMESPPESDHWLHAIICFCGLFCAGIAMYAASVVADAQTAALLIAVSAFFWGSALPPLFALSLQILPMRAVASGVGVFNGIGNIVGALSPLVMGALIAHTGSFDAGLMVLVGATIVGSFAMLPLVRRF